MADQATAGASAPEARTLTSSVPAKPAAAPAALAAPTEGVADAIRDEIATWFVERIHDSPVSRNTEIVNYIREAVQALEARLIARLAR